MALPFLAAGAAKLGASWLARKGVTTAIKKAVTPTIKKIAPSVLSKIKSSGTSAALVKATGSSKIAKAAASAVKSLTGVSALQKAGTLWKSGGLINKAKAVGYGALGTLGLKFTKDTITGAVTPAAAASEMANDPFQAAEGAGAESPTIGPNAVDIAPYWDAPDILPDFIEQRLEDLTPAQLKILGYGAAGLGALGVGAGLYTKREEIMDMMGLGDGSTIATPTERRKQAKKKPSKEVKGPTFKTLSKEWKKLPKGEKDMYEGKFSDYVKVQRDMRSAAAPTTTKRAKPKKGKGKAKGKSKKQTAQQNRMKAAAKKWKKYSGSMSYQEFMSKELNK